MNRMIIITGPSCIGKSPLYKALQKLRPELAFQLRKIVLYNSRAPRSGEKEGVDYHFRTRAELQSLQSHPDFMVMEVRGDVHALDRKELQQAIASGPIFFEGNPFVGTHLLQYARELKFSVTSLFLTPLSKEEIFFLQGVEPAVSLSDFVTNLMRRKLLRRMQREKGILSQPDLAEVERRALSAYEELKTAHRFDWVLPNHDGEDSDNWEACYYPISDARRAVLVFAALIEGQEPIGAERWESELLT
jgi:guanylate kinase